MTEHCGISQVLSHGCQRGDTMVTKPEIDNGKAFDWGKTSPDYAVYRPGYPASFYTMLQAVGIGQPEQDVLDLGTGTGVLARAFAQQWAHVIGMDIAAA